jgi:flagellar hook protein FlgE
MKKKIMILLTSAYLISGPMHAAYAMPYSTNIKSPAHKLYIAKYGVEIDLSELTKDGRRLALRDGMTGSISYTSNSLFTIKNGYFFQDNKRLQGYPLLRTANSCELQDVKINYDKRLSPVASDYAHINMNLNASSSIPTAEFNLRDTTSFNYEVATQYVYDSLGGQHDMTFYFIKEASNAWNIEMSIDGSALYKSGHLTFNPNGELVSQNGFSNINFTPSNGSLPLTLAVDFTATTQYSADSALNNVEVNGHTSGAYAGMEVSPYGLLSALYSNQVSMPIMNIALLINPCNAVIN